MTWAATRPMRITKAARRGIECQILDWTGLAGFEENEVKVDGLVRS
jgi:hypothetical protein